MTGPCFVTAVTPIGTLALTSTDKTKRYQIQIKIQYHAFTF